MNIISLLILLLWLASGFLVVQFVRRTGGSTVIGRIAHWFGGAFVMLGLAVGMIWTYAQFDDDFGARAKAYLLTHQLRSTEERPLIRYSADGGTVTVFRRGSVNTAATFDGGQLTILEQHTVRTSLWWMLWDTSYIDPLR